MPDTVNITQIARKFHATTPNIRKRLDRLGVAPIQEIEMPSGRKFVLFDKGEAFAVLEQEQKAREQALAESFNPSPVPSPQPAANKASDVDLKALAADVAELKSLLSQVLDAITTPKSKE